MRPGRARRTLPLLLCLVPIAGSVAAVGLCGPLPEWRGPLLAALLAGGAGWAGALSLCTRAAPV